MLNLHNILLISPPQNHPPLPPPRPPPPPSISSDHQNIIHHHQDSNNNSTNLHEDDNSFTRVCRDCGNRAKKECAFRRCRTCCKTRGFDCATHMRSTWIPAAKRREKKLMTTSVSGGSCGAGGGASSGSSCGVKRPRVFWSPARTLNAAPSPSTLFNASVSTSLSFNTGPCYQEERFKKSLPGEVQAPADFRCIRVTAIGDDEAEVGYVATVNISGHVFKGYLYDHGIDEKKLFPCISQTQMETDVSTARNRYSSSPIGDHSNAYETSGN